MNGTALAELLQPRRQAEFVVPDFLGGAGALKEEKCGFDIGVGGEGAGRQADNRVQVEALQQLLLDRGKSPTPEEGSLRHDHAAAGAVAGLELLHNVLEK